MEEKLRLSHAELMELKRWNTPTIYNGWEQITKCNSAREGFNLEEVSDFMPHMGPMVGYAVTVVIEPGNKLHPESHPEAWIKYREYIASLPGPKIVVVQDLDKPSIFGAFWGEVNSNIHKALGCVGTITDGGIRDLDEMNNAGFKALARRLCVGHAHSWPVRWDCEVEVFGRKVLPGELIHADKHGFLVISDKDQKGLLDAAKFMDSNECKTVIPAGRSAHGKSFHSIVDDFNKAASKFSAATNERFRNKGEW